MSTDPRREASFQLDQLQCGLEPEMWKPMSTIGASARGIRVTDGAGGVRVMILLHPLRAEPP